MQNFFKTSPQILEQKLIQYSSQFKLRILYQQKFLASFLLVLILLFGFVGIFGSVSTEAATLTPSRELICGGSCPLFDSDFNFTIENLARFIVSIARFLTFLGVLLAVFFLVFAGIQFIIGKEEEAKENIRTTLIGLVIIIIAYTAVSLIVSLLQGNFLGSAINGNF